ncbi:hypothetical protein H0H87_002485 [Tephrocybe sp. NHM501043]|nr:hypothetical protein H0H87_002485 [Tephrocybe sp. NHM501043]
MFKSTSLTALLLLIPLVSAHAVPKDHGASGLNTLAQKSKKLYFGSATDNYELNDAPYAKILRDNKMFGQITPETTESVRGQFNFTAADELVDWAHKNGQILRGHTCVWHSQLPSWVSAGGFDAKTLTSIIETHTATEVGHFKGKICKLLHAWDVVNEAFNEDGTFRETVFYNTLNSSYIEIAFRAARKADPKAKLYINDYNIDGTGPKSTAVINLVKDLKKKKVPIDGVGLQGHLVVGTLPTDIEENIRAITATGVEVAITELDIRMPTPPTPENLAQQKKDYEYVIASCKAVKGCIGVTIWDYSDKYSWVPGVFAGEGAPLPWDENLEKKPAYDGIVDGWTN